MRDKQWNIELQQRATIGTMGYASIILQADLNEENKPRHILGVVSHGQNGFVERIFKASFNSYKTMIHHVVSLFSK